MSSIVATTLKLLYTGGLITEYVMRSQVQWLPVLYVEPIILCTCYTNRFSLHVHVSLGSCR